MASRLLSELIGDDDNYDYEDEEYYDEEYEEFYSPYAEPPPIAPVFEEKQEPVELQPKIEIETVFCDICGVDIPKPSMEFHEDSKRHRGAILNQKVRANQEKAEIESRERLRKGKMLFDAVFTPKIIELITQFVPTKQLMKLRLVSRKWKDYLDQPEAWKQQHFFHKGISIHSLNECYENPEFPLINLGFKFILANDSGMHTFLDKPHYNITRIHFHMKGLLCTPETLWKAVCAKFATIPSQVIFLDFLVQNAVEGQEVSEFTSVFTEELFSALAQNKNIDSLECYLSRHIIVNRNPLPFLESNRHLRCLTLFDRWFMGITENNEIGAVEFEEKEKRQNFSFRSTSVTSLTIKNTNSLYQFKDLRGEYLIKALQGNSKLEELSLSDLSLCGKKIFRKHLEKFIESTKTLKKLDLSKNKELCKIDWNILANNTNIETLDLSETKFGTLHSINWKNNDTMRHLYLRASLDAFTAKQLQKLPPSLQTLDISGNGYTPISNVFVGLSDTLPCLTHLDVSGYNYITPESICSFVETTKSVRTLFLFKNTRCSNGNFDHLHVAFAKNSSITICDHELAQENLLHRSYVEEISRCLKKNASMNLGRRTKGIR